MAKRPVLSKAHKLAIGELVLNASLLNSVIIDMLTIAMGTHALYAIIAFNHQQTTSNIDTLKTLYSLGDEKAPNDPVLALLQRARDLADFRNTIVHAYWTRDKQGQVLAVRYQARGKFSRSRKPYSAESIQGKAREMHATFLKLSAIRDHIHAEAAKNHAS